MTKITPIALTVTGDEKAIGLLELNQQPPDGGADHRYQLIYVVRNGEPAEFRFDMGLSKKWKGVKYLNIPSLLEHTVDELRDIADEIRQTDKIDKHDFLEIDKMKFM